MDPSLQIDVLTELELGESTAGVRQVPGLHNGTKAFLFQGMAHYEDPCLVGGADPREGLANLALHPCVPAGAGGSCAPRTDLLKWGGFFPPHFPRPPPHLVHLAVLMDSALITD